MNLETKRLTLRGGTIEALEADLRGTDDLARELNCIVPGNWPPLYYDAPAIEYTLNSMRSQPKAEVDTGFGLYYFILREDTAGPAPAGPTLVGVGGFGFKEEAGEGVVELGYGVLPQYQKRGIATEAVQAFLRHSFANSSVRSVIAQTMPDLVASIRVLDKSGFTLRGSGLEEGAILYAIERTGFSGW